MGGRGSAVPENRTVATAPVECQPRDGGAVGDGSGDKIAITQEVEDPGLLERGKEIALVSGFLEVAARFGDIFSPVSQVDVMVVVTASMVRLLICESERKGWLVVRSVRESRDAVQAQTKIHG